jgi:hypothetical protein
MADKVTDIDMTNIDIEPFLKLYDNFDKGHDRRHVEAVRTFSHKLATKYCPDLVNLVDLGAVLHDIGLTQGRGNHELASGSYMLMHTDLIDRVDYRQFNELMHIVVNHRASNGNPSTVAAKIISDADRIGSDSMSHRVVRIIYSFINQFGSKFTYAECVRRALKYCCEKYGDGGHGRRVYFLETLSAMRELYNEDWTPDNVDLFLSDMTDGDREASVEYWYSVSRLPKKYYGTGL